MFWNQHSRLYIERTGDNIYGEWRRNRVVAGTNGKALEVHSVVVGASSVEAKD